MKASCTIAFVLMAAMAVFAVEQVADLPKLKSMHGTMITIVGGKEGLPCEIWANGDNVRTEQNVGGQKIINIQLGDTLYTYGAGSAKGNKTRFEAGLASMGIIKQIAKIKSKGEKQGAHDIEGVMYDEFLYSAPQERATVYLARNTSLPRSWVSAVQNGEERATELRMRYRNMEANINIPDDMFTLPRGVTFSEVPLAELMATARVVGQRPAVAPELKSLHGKMLVRVSDDKNQPFEIWAKGDNVRAEHTANDQKIINIQLGDKLYTCVKGSTTGRKRHMSPGLRSLGLIKQIEQIKSKGTKAGSQVVEGAMYDEYHYDLDAPAEKAVIYLSTETSAPGVWISHVKRQEQGENGILVMQYRDMETNVEIPDDMFVLPREVTFSEVPIATKTE